MGLGRPGLDFDFIPIISESMSGSRDWRFTTYAGTSKTLDGTLEKLFERSSKAEWVIKCPRCRRENIASASEDLLNMIGPKGLICGLKKCGAPLNTRQGFWLHQFPDRIPLNSGWHIPQPILPMHCENARAWAALLRKRKEYREATFINECLGEACDVGTKLITINQIKKASVLPIRNNINKALKYCQKSRYIAQIIHDHTALPSLVLTRWFTRSCRHYGEAAFDSQKQSVVLQAAHFLS